MGFSHYCIYFTIRIRLLHKWSGSIRFYVVKFLSAAVIMKIIACALTHLGSTFSLLPSRLEILLRKTLYCLPAYAVILHYHVVFYYCKNENVILLFHTGCLTTKRNLNSSYFGILF